MNSLHPRPRGALGLAFRVSVVLASASTPACRSGDSDAAAASSSAAPPASAVPVDRLAPGELRPGEHDAFGLVLPRGMEIVGRFRRSVHAAGTFRPEDVANYVRERVVVDRVELGAARTIFPNARIENAPPAKRFRIEVVASSRTRTVIEVHDVTPPPTIQGIDDTERWRRAGFKPNGTPLDPSKLE